MNRNHRSALLLIITLFMSLLFSCQISKGATGAGDKTPQSQPSDKVIIDSQADQVYEIGDIVSVGKTILVVLGWDIYPGGTQFPPEAGYQHLAVDLLVANQGKDTFEFSPGHSLTLKDSTEQIYYMNGMSGYVSGSTNPEGEITPGEIMRGKVGFQVPEDQADFVLLFESDQYNGGEISVNLDSTPVSLAPPADLGLKLQQQIFQIGESAKILGQVIQVIEVIYPADNEIVAPKEGYRSVVIDVQIENQGDATLYFTGPEQIYLKDSTGQKYSSDSLALPAGSDNYLIGNLEPGENIRGQEGFYIPEDAVGLIFVFDPDQFELGKVFISLD